MKGANVKTRLAVPPLLSCTLICFTCMSVAQTGRRLWVLQAPDQIVEYDPSTWEVRNTRKLPAGAVKDPRSFSINGRGQMLFCPISEGEYGSSGITDKVWFWNGQSIVSLDRRMAPPKPVAGGRSIQTVESTPQCALSTDGQRLYWFENELRIQKNADGIEASVTTTMRAWQTDLDGGHRVQIASYSFAPCQCGTGACPETCPEAGFWFPDDGVDSLFIVNHWIPGQIGATYQSSFLYLNSEGKWLPHKLPLVLEETQDAVRGGAIIMHTLPDGGCCGWENESNDQTHLFANGKDVVIYDEYLRYGNTDYDVSFLVSKARFSPDARSAALAIESTVAQGADIRLSDEGKPNPGELARIRQAIAELPAVEIVRLEDPPKRSAFLRHSALVGWLSDREILIVEGGVLVAFEIDKGIRRRSRINVANPALVFVR